MKAVIFAGGAGTRLWPLSRKYSPKQFEKLIGSKSTVQLAVERLLPEFKKENIYIATNIIYKRIVEEQLPEIPKKNFIFEPTKKDVGPAIALLMGMFYQTDPDEPVAILWSDHLVKKVAVFKKILQAAGKLIDENPNRIIFIGQKPRYPSTNLGYIHFGRENCRTAGFAIYGFEGWRYKPDRATAKNFFQSGKYAWNLGYFVSSPAFIYKAYERLAPNIYKNTEKILQSYGKKEFKKAIEKDYAKVESINFDNAILENLEKTSALVMVEDIGWSDVGAWEALKEALETHQSENVIRGRTFLDRVRDSLIYNYEEGKLIVGVDLNKNIVVNTEDVILIAKKSSIDRLQKLVKDFEGTEHEKLT